MTNGRRGALVLVGTPIGNLGDLSPRVVEALRTRGRDRVRGHAAHAQAPVARRHRGGRPAAGGARAQRGAARPSGSSTRSRDGLTVVYATDAGHARASAIPARGSCAPCRTPGCRSRSSPGPSAALAALALSGLPGRPVRVRGVPAPQGRRPRSSGSTRSRPSRAPSCSSKHPAGSPRRWPTWPACGADRPVCVAREITKLHEEVFQRPLEEAAAAGRRPVSRGRARHRARRAPAETAAATDEAVDDAVRDALGARALGTDAAAEVAAELGVPKRRAYELAAHAPEAVSFSTHGSHTSFLELAQLGAGRWPGRTRTAARPSRARCGRRPRPRSRRGRPRGSRAACAARPGAPTRPS